MARLLDIHEAAPIVERPIRSIGERTDQPNLWDGIVEDCEANQAFCFVQGESFTVLKPIIRDGKSTLCLLVCYSPLGNGYELFMPFIEERARELGCSDIEFWTRIEGMNRYARKVGWNKKFTVWSKDV